MKVIVAHPYKQHSFRTAEGLLKENALCAYITSVYLKPGNLTDFVFRKIDEKNKKRAETHRSKLLDDMVVQFDELFGLFMTFIRRIPIMNKAVPKLDLIFFRHFGWKVARYAIQKKADAVIMYDTTAMWCFQYLKKYGKNIKCILDMSAITLDGQEKSYEYDSSLCMMQWYKNKTNSKHIKNELKEIKLADGYIVASEYTMNDLIAHGVSAEEIYIIPYGYEQEHLKREPNKEEHSIPLKALYVGRITHKKGVHHLLSALSDISDKEIELTLAGRYTVDPILYEQYNKKKNYKFVGFMGREQLYRLYRESDVLVVPSLSDGYGLVVLEGMSCGLPVIASSCTGASSIIKDKVNGIRYDTYSEHELKNALTWFVHNMNRLPEMRIMAQQTVNRYTWENYYEKVVQAVDCIIEGEHDDGDNCFKLQ